MPVQLSGSLVITGSVYATQGITGSFSGSATSASFASTLQGLGSASFAPAGTFNAVSQSFATTSGSLSTRVTNLESTSSTVSSSFATTSGSIASRVNVIETSYATTGSNTFSNIQYISSSTNAAGFTTTASLYTDGGLRVGKDSFISGTAYFNNVVVYGTSSIQYITSSQVNIGASYINLNTNLPAQRYGGINVADSGSNVGVTGSLLWDSLNNRWIYANPSGSTYDGGMLISGPRNSTGLGNEVGTTSCALMMGQGGDHITSSAIFSYGNATCFYGNALFVSSSCSVGVGTSSPSYTTANRTVLAVDGNTSALYALQNTGSAVGYVYGDASSVVLWAEGSRNLTVGVAAGGCTILTTNNSSRLTISPVGNATFACNLTALSITTSAYSYLYGLRISGNDTGNTIYAGNSSMGITADSGNRIFVGQVGSSTAGLNVITATGNVSIGTASPTQALTVNGNAAVGGQQAFWLRDDDGFSSSSARRAWAMTANYAAFGMLSLYVANTAATSPLSGSAVFNITSGGIVGIGTTNPSGRLNVYGAKQAITSDVALVNVDDSTSFATGVGGSLLLRGNYRSIGDQVAGAGIEASKVNSTEGDYGFNMLFYTRQNGCSLGEKMRIQSTGQVGIGTTNTSTEANLFLGAQGPIEGGQLVLQKGTSCSCATHLDNYQDSFRILVGTDTGSTGVNMSINHKTGIVCTPFGIKFGGGGGVLNYYEEGTFTPCMSIGGMGVYYSNRAGSYIKVGNLVTVQVYLAVCFCGTYAGTGFNVTNLPFATSTAGAVEEYAASFWQVNAAGVQSIGAVTSRGATQIGFACRGTNGSMNVNLAPTADSTVRDLNFTVTYKAS